MRQHAWFLCVLCASMLVAASADAGVAQPPGSRLTAAQLKRVLIGKSWDASWGPFSSRITFARDGIFRDGITQPRRWHFAADKICIAVAPAANAAENCLDFYSDAGALNSWVWSNGSGQYLATYHGPMP